MKGIVFTEFLEMVEEHFGIELADRIIAESELPNDGAYSAVGTYDHQELVRLVSGLSKATGTDVPCLLRTFGEHLFARLASAYPELIKGSECSFDLLGRVHGVIHVEVKKLYPQAELPSFQCEAGGPDGLVMHYRSPRGFADLAEGLIKGCATYYGESLDVRRDDLSGGKGTNVRFELRRKAA